MTRSHLKTTDMRLICGLAVLLLVLFAACSSKLVRGASPIVRISELSQVDGASTLLLSVRNLNGVAIDIRNIEFSLSLNDEAFLRHSSAISLAVAANGTEAWSVEAAASGGGADLLKKLEAGELISLPYRLEGSVSTQAEGLLRFEQEGHLYPLPGRPGHFR